MRLTLNLLLALGLVALVGCPTATDDDDATVDDDDTAPDDDDTAPDDDDTAPDDDDTAPDDDDTAPDDDDSATSPERCEAFCTGLMAICTGANEQMGGDAAACETECAGWAPGTQGDAAGNSLACREYHLGAARDTDADLHCPHAGGQAVCVD
jgi:hypothetical protein